MEPSYRHTQVGWVMLAATALVAWLGSRALPAAGSPGVAILAVVVLVLVLFSTLRVEVDRQEIRLGFGVGLPRKRIPLGSVRAWEAVRNPWYTGWGIRMGSRGTTWNVSGFDAVELALEDGRRFRIGTDEPEALVAAIGRAKATRGEPAVDPGPAVPGTPVRLTWPAWVVGLLVVGVPIGWMFYAQTRPPQVVVDASGFEVKTPFYGQRYAASEIASVELLQRMPRVIVRTNGFAGAGSLRGWFQVEGLGRGKLFVDLGTAPYLLVRLRDGSFAIVNSPDPQRTAALYEQLRPWGRVLN